MMKKDEFIARVAARATLNKKNATAAVDAFLSVLEETLHNGEDIQFIGFGKFSVADVPEREHNNPATGAKVKVAAHKAPKFSFSDTFKKTFK